MKKKFLIIGLALSDYFAGIFALVFYFLTHETIDNATKRKAKRGGKRIGEK